jgi:hypothetical protein
MATARKKPRTAAQKRATAKLVALNKARRSGRTSRTSAKRRPARRTTRRVRRSNPVETIMSNPRRRRSKARRSNPRRTSRAAATHAGRTLRYRRRNPIGGLGEFVTGQLVPSAIGGGGALLLDVALAVLPIPATMKVGAMAPIVRIAGAVGIGALAGMVTNRKTANQIAAGALTVTMYQIARGFLARALPAGSVPGLSAPPFYDPALPGGMGEYVSGDVDYPQLGYIQSGQYVGGQDDFFGDANEGVGEYVDGSMEGYETGVYR